MLPPIEQLVPHRARMSLLDRVTHAADGTVTAIGTVRADSPLAHDGAIGGWVAIEYMAQAVAAYAGVDAHAQGGPPKVGFLLGTRALVFTPERIAVGTTLTVTVVRQLQDPSGLGSFDGTVTGDDGFRATATLSVFQPDDVQRFLQETGS
ncbi:MAG: hypothetical protein MUF21_06070 [Gemmatimonadaceae bacterium]|jgi:predicted hotdog family 3-hydroxylacyl-ACP dehydratase|nr:hypothetical protein [Gemmatimonadaceae bacterium]